MGQLQALIAAQSRDDQTHRLRRRRKEVRATDLGTPADPGAGWTALNNAPSYDGYGYLADRYGSEQPSTLVGISMIWGAEEVAFHRGKTCRGCHNAIQGDHRPRRTEGRGFNHYCLVCSASSKDPRQWPPPLSGRMAARKLKGGVGQGV
jgi:hypothetical protein